MSSLSTLALIRFARIQTKSTLTALLFPDFASMPISKVTALPTVISSPSQRGDVKENVVAAVVWLDEAEASFLAIHLDLAAHGADLAFFELSHFSVRLAKRAQ
jgi:hypothetical protein